MLGRDVLSIPTLVLSTIAYLTFYSLFTGAIQYLPAQRLELERNFILLTYVTSQTYTGPLLQIIGEGYLIDVRIISAIMGVVVSVLFGINISILWKLYRTGKIRTCLVGAGGGGTAALIASLACSSYLCCGWAPSLILLGVAAATTLTMVTTPIAIALLTINAIILTKRARQVMVSYS